jgi:hypothetical protein
MSKIFSPDQLGVVHEAYAALNKSYLRLFLTAARTHDPIASRLLGIDQDVLFEYASVNTYDLIAPSKIGAPLVRPILRDPSSIKDLIDSKVSAAELFSRYFYRRHDQPSLTVIKSMPVPPAPDATLAVQASILEFNEQVIKMILTVANSNDLIAAFLLRLDSQTLEVYKAMTSYDIKKISKIGLPLARPFLTDAASIRASLASGCSTSIVLQQLSCETPEIKRTQRTKEAQ